MPPALHPSDLHHADHPHDLSRETAIKDVRLVRGTSTVFDGLTLRLDQFRIGLIGDNGAGKSSLFRLLCGLEQPQHGSVTVAGHRMGSSPLPPGLLGMMFQNADDQIIFPTVEEELALSLSPTGVSRREAQAKAREFLAARGLAHWSERTIASLSQGQRQHVCWLALMIASPRLLLLDEPFASLDLPGRALLDTDLAKASQKIIVSTHLLDHVRHFERVIWLQQGQVKMDATGPVACAAYEADVAARSANRQLSIDDGL
jgi:biotin transport system ATP-binding protein